MFDADLALIRALTQDPPAYLTNRMLANDRNAGVREWAWLALRGQIAVDVAHAKLYSNLTSNGAWGWNVGILWKPVPAIGVGASYRSKITVEIQQALKDWIGKQADLISGCRTGLPTPVLSRWVSLTWRLFWRVFAQPDAQGNVGVGGGVETVGIDAPAEHLTPDGIGRFPERRDRHIVFGPNPAVAVAADRELG